MSLDIRIAITCVLIELLAWLLVNCCVVTELIVFFELCTCTKHIYKKKMMKILAEDTIHPRAKGKGFRRDSKNISHCRALSLFKTLPSCWARSDGETFTVPVRDSRNRFLASANPAWVLVPPDGKFIIDNLLSAVEYGKNLKLTLAEEEKVTAAYFWSYLFSTAIAFALFIKFLIATFPLLNSQSPTDPEPSMTITLSISFGVSACLLRRVFVGFINKKLVMNLFAVTPMEGTVWNSEKENKTIKIKRILHLHLQFKNLCTR